MTTAACPAIQLYFCNFLVSPQICVVKERNPTEMRDLPSRYVEIGITIIITEVNIVFKMETGCQKLYLPKVW